ncbi:Flp pilus assembly protein CpaB [Novosphingobium ginsenosidimutans]|uniref:Flp pilus assembly protein CpaB n=1 Tax=Novosphingobium ginsenosidimutans TaxID=1176536 RepID=A0A5B8RZX4_9SPHN|nr:Flp pilus assembly protein CpaB [Novosphingobium ginsenosidimutans]QEA14939.1 Flp pilus assembly protein CpaB [Novosphingobium ginsenosidimutans]
MDKKKLMLLLGALVVAIGTAMAARTLFAGASAPQAEAAQVPQGPKVLVAQRALPVGTIITADSISFQAWPKEMVQDAYFIDGEADMNKLLGTVVRYPVTAGQPVTQGALVSPGDRGFLAAALGPGMRAVTIPVSQKTGVAGFVFPGDHVDLVLTQTVRGDDGGSSGALKAAETILRNVRVLATDQSTETEIVEGKTVVRGFRSITVEVTPKIAEKVAVAQTIGTISLALRSLADNQTELDQAIASGTVKVPAGATKEQEEKLLGQAMNRPIDGATSFVTGGDVSRFQRRTLAPASIAPRAVAASAPSSAGASVIAAAPQGPVVRVTRGKNTSVEQVGRR